MIATWTPEKRKAARDARFWSREAKRKARPADGENPPEPIQKKKRP